ncbi:MAG: YceI family protein [Bacteroidia bacterium]|nr:YceI family protein [Bacteroidia bacterium]
MNIRNYFLIAFAATALIACGDANTAETGDAGTAAEAAATATTYVVDQAASTLAWQGANITGKSHNGVITISEGSMSVDGAALTAGNFTVDMTTITDLDIEDPEYNGKLVGHLSADDFFAVATYPTATFEITKVEAVEGDPAVSHHISGNLTIKGITNEVKIPALVSMNGDDLSAKASFVIDRAKWNVQYGSGSFFEDLGDKLILDEITFNLDLVSHKGGNGMATAAE